MPAHLHRRGLLALRSLGAQLLQRLLKLTQGLAPEAPHPQLLPVLLPGVAMFGRIVL